MKDQHEKIRGYRDLNQGEVDRVNTIKAMGEGLRGMIDALRTLPGADQRWTSIAETHLQQGIMAAVRAIAQPTTF